MDNIRLDIRPDIRPDIWPDIRPDIWADIRPDIRPDIWSEASSPRLRISARFQNFAPPSSHASTNVWLLHNP